MSYLNNDKLRLAVGGRDMAKSQNHIKLFDFEDGKFKELYTNTNNGNFIVISQNLYYLRLLTTNAIELVIYDINGLKEIERIKNENSVEVS